SRIVVGIASYGDATLVVAAVGIHVRHFPAVHWHLVTASIAPSDAACLALGVDVYGYLATFKSPGAIATAVQQRPRFQRLTEIAKIRHVSEFQNVPGAATEELHVCPARELRPQPQRLLWRSVTGKSANANAVAQDFWKSPRALRPVRGAVVECARVGGERYLV